MASPFGISFVTGAQPDNQNGMSGGRGGASRNPIQEAVKILSLRLPKFDGSGSIAPAPLLQAPGGMGQPGARGNVTAQALAQMAGDRKSTRLNSSHSQISYAVFCLKKTNFIARNPLCLLPGRIFELCGEGRL